MHRLLFGLCLFTACAPPPRPALPVPPPDPAPPEPLTTVSIDARTVAIEGLVLDARGQNVARLVFSGAPLGCDFGPRGDDARLELTLVRGLGDRGWRVPRMRLGLGPDEGALMLDLDEAPRVQLPRALAEAMTVRTHFNVPIELDGRSVRVEVDGALPVAGCGSFEPEPIEPLPDLLVTVGEEALPIVGALYRRDRITRQHSVTLSTAPLTCDVDPREAEVVIDLTLDRMGRSVEAMVIGGMRVGEPIATSLDKGALRSGLRGLGRSVRVQLNGETRIGAYPFGFEGQAEVTICR